MKIENTERAETARHSIPSESKTGLKVKRGYKYVLLPLSAFSFIALFLLQGMNSQVEASEKVLPAAAHGDPRGRTILLSEYEPPGMAPEELKVKNQQVEVVIDDASPSHERRVSFYEKVQVAIKDGSKATGYRMVVPASYQLPFELTKQAPLRYHLLGEGKINGHDTLPKIAAPVREIYRFLSLKKGEEVAMKSLPEENVFEVRYEIKNFPLVDEKSGRGYFTWTFPSPSRPLYVDQAKLRIVLPSSVKRDQVGVKHRRVQYLTTSDGFADGSKGYVSPSPLIEEVRVLEGKSPHGDGSEARVQVVATAKELKPFEAIEILVGWEDGK